jgi:hypothetical protein
VLTQASLNAALSRLRAIRWATRQPAEATCGAPNASPLLKPPPASRTATP